MPASGVNLIDANVWLALAVGGHVHHPSAVRWFESAADDSCAFCRITQLALLRHLTNSRIMGASVQTQEKAWQSYEALSRDPRVLFLSESARISSVFKELTQGGFPGHEQWTDAYLAAFAETSEIGMVTFDAGFRHGASLPVQLLT